MSWREESGLSGLGECELIDPNDLLLRRSSGPGYARGREYLVVVVPFLPGRLPPADPERRILAEMAAEATRNIVDMCKPRFIRAVGAKRTVRL
jgi:hypothetical protein